MQVFPIRHSEATQTVPRRRVRQRRAESAGASAAGAGQARVPQTAVVAVEPATASERPATPSARYRPDAAFLAHLIATRDHAPQARVRRRAEPAEAEALYRAVAARPHHIDAGDLVSVAL